MKKQKRRKVLIAVPTQTGMVTTGTHKSLLHDSLRLALGGVEVQFCDRCGHADIYLLRAQIVSAFLATDCDDLVMIDSDLAWEPGGLIRLLAHDVDLVAGAYPKRKDPIEFMFRSAEGPLMGDPTTGLVEVWGMPGGFMRARRPMLEKMAEAYKDLTVHDPISPTGSTVRLFDPYWFDTPNGRSAMSEDYAFCQRWRDLGGKVWMDVGIALAHIGHKAFAGRLGDFLAPNAKQEAA